MKEATTVEMLDQYHAEEPLADRNEAARHFDIHPDSIPRIYRNAGRTSPWAVNAVGPPKKRVTPEQLQRMRDLAADGMVATWIAETVGFSPEAVRHHLGPRPEVAPQWRPVWQEIRRNEELAKLHREFAPAGSRVGLRDEGRRAADRFAA